MKKILLATTALAAVSLVSVAQAQESNMMSAAGNELNIGGYYEFGYVTFDESKGAKGDSVDTSKTYGESELHIDFENTSDSGLTYGVHLELEVIDGNDHEASGKKSNGDFDNANNTDEANIYLSGDFGRVNLGHQDGAYGSFITWANTHSGSTSQDDTISGVSSLGANEPGSLAPYTGAAGGMTYGDDSKIGYFSPNFSGFKFGVSIEDNDKKGNPSSFGASYNTELGDVGVLGGTTLGLTYAYASNGGDGDTAATETSIGFSVGLGDLAFAVSNYSGTGNGDDNKDISRRNLELSVGYQISDSLAVGLSRSTGTAKKFAYTAAVPASGTTAATAASVGAGDTHEDEGTYTSLSGQYSIAPGLRANLAINQFENTRTNKATKATMKNDGQEVVFQVRFAF